MINREMSKKNIFQKDNFAMDSVKKQGQDSGSIASSESGENAGSLSNADNTQHKSNVYSEAARSADSGTSHTAAAAPAHSAPGAHGEAAPAAHTGAKEGGHGEGGPPEIPNIVSFIKQYPSVKNSEKTIKVVEFLEVPFFTLIVIVLISLIVRKGTKKLEIIPGRLQNAIEYFVEGFESLVVGILGKKNGRVYLPYVGTLFLYIFVNNLLGIVPFMKSPTSVIFTTVALALITFFYVQYIGLTKNGILGFLHHLAGSPADAIGWILSPFMFVLHIISELAKPLSLSLRLFGNIFGEDILLGSFVMMGVGFMAFLHLDKIPVGIPFQFPFLFLAFLTSIIQALVFSILSTIYIMLVLPHDEEEHHE